MRLHRFEIAIAAIATLTIAAVTASALPADATISSVVVSTNNPGSPSTTPVGQTVGFRALPGSGSTTTVGTVTLTDTSSSIGFSCQPSTNTRLDGSVRKGAGSPSGLGTIPGPTAVASPTNTYNVHFGSATWAGAVDGSSGTFTVGTTPCLFLGSEPFAVVPCTNSWRINVTNQSSAAPFPPSNPASGQATPVSITNICASVYIRRGGAGLSCHFDLASGTGPTGSTLPRTATASNTGSVSGTYTNTTPRGSLSISNSGQVLKVSNAPSSGCAGGLVENGDSFALGGSGFAVGVRTPPSGTSDAIWLNAAP